MGQEILNGNLPYVNLWDMKSPFLHGVYALFILMFGKSVAAIRFGGALCVFISACFIRDTGRKLYGDAAGWWAALLLAVYSSTLISGFSTMTEHIAMVPASIILWTLLTKELNKRNIFVAGILAGIMILVRSSLVYLAFLAGLIVFLEGMKRKDVFRAATNGITYTCGALIFPLVTVGVYFFNGYLPLFTESFIMANLGWAQGHSRSITSHVFELNKLVMFSVLSKNILIWVLSFFGTFFGLFSFSYEGERIKEGVLVRPREKSFVGTVIILAFLVFAALSIVQAGRYYESYLIDIMPFLSLLGGAAIAGLLSYGRVWRKLLIIFFIAGGIALPLLPTFKGYVKIARDIKQNRSFYSGSQQDIIEYLKTRNVEGEYIFLPEYHIAYWLTGAKIPMKFAHPSEIFKPYFVETIIGEGENHKTVLNAIFAKKPKIIFVPKRKPWFFKEDGYQMLREEIGANYVFDKDLGYMKAYKRKEAEQ